MKRLPLLFSLLAVIALSASIAYWFMQLYKPEQRPLTAAPGATMPEPASDAAATLFGGQALAAVASNYQLTGVVSAGREGVAILVADGQPPKAVKIGKEIGNGVTVSEVHPKYVMLSEGGVLKRIELATDVKAGASMSAPMMPQTQQMMPPPEPPPTPVQQPQPVEVPNQLPQGVPPPPPPMQMPAPTRGVSSGGPQQPPPTQ